MSVSELMSKAVTVKQPEEERFVWFRAENGDDPGRKDYKFLEDMEKAKGVSGARVTMISVPYSPDPEREQHYVVYAAFRGDFNPEQKKILSQGGRELDASTFNSDNALLNHLNGYNEEIDTNIDLTQKPSSHDAFEGIDNRRRYRIEPRNILADFHFDEPTTRH